MEIEWKDVVGFEGIYMVSNIGIIVSVKTGKCKSTKRNNRGYVQIHLFKNNKEYMKLLHRVVAEAFIPNENNYSQVNHMDEDKENNCVTNLEWCTNAYNRHYGTGIERMAKNRNQSEIVTRALGIKIIQKDISGKVIKTYDCIKQACNELKLSHQEISKAIKGLKSSHGGYIWERV